MEIYELKKRGEEGRKTSVDPDDVLTTRHPRDVLVEHLRETERVKKT